MLIPVRCYTCGEILADKSGLRHKSKKRSFIAVLWLTVIVNCSAIWSLYYFQLI